MIATAQGQIAFNGNATPTIVTNTTTTTNISPLIQTSGFGAYLGVQVDVVNASGTLAGNVILQGSLTGVNFANISTDTLKLSSTNFSKVWTVDPWAYRYLRVIAYPTGTQSDTLNAYFINKTKR